MANKKVFVAGGSGFVGSYIVRELIESGYTVKALARNGELGTLPDAAIAVSGDILSPYSWCHEAADCDVFINIVGIIREYPKYGVTFKRIHTEAAACVVEACKKAGIERLIHMSANGASAAGVSAYQVTKYDAEQIIKASKLNYTIMRPSLIFGTGDAFLNKIAQQMDEFGAFPIFGNGWYMMQPVFAGDVAKAFCRVIDIPECAHQTYHLGGAKAYQYRELLHMLATALGKKIYMPHIPLKAAQIMASVFGRFRFFPITRDQLDMLVEGNICHEHKLFDICGISPRDVKAYIIEHFE